MPSASFPKRVICLTEETTETLYALGADELIVGISGFTVRPKNARKTKPKISTYLDANIDKIVDLKPDMIFAWSDLQAGICAELIRAGIEVVCFNHRSIDGILSMILRLGSLVGKQKEAFKYINRLEKNIRETVRLVKKRKYRPRVYFEEWYDPLITGICWVSEIIELCGGIDIFSENRAFPDAKRRILSDNSEVIRRSPDILLASWCGKQFKPEKVKAREGWLEIPAVRDNHIYEIHSSIILQPGPAALTEGITSVMHIFDGWEKSQC
ncbi:MAG: cobalamin-binding protein [Ignavibacteriae bacterium]|nr:cobalamin-binding protein [Ignavibacteriota bacterium]